MRLVTIGSLGASAALGLGALVVAKVLLPAAASNQVQAAPIVCTAAHATTSVEEATLGRTRQADDATTNGESSGSSTKASGGIARRIIAQRVCRSNVRAMPHVTLRFSIGSRTGRTS